MKRRLKENLFVPQRAPHLTLQCELLRPESCTPGSGGRADQVGQHSQPQALEVLHWELKIGL